MALTILTRLRRELANATYSRLATLHQSIGKPQIVQLGYSVLCLVFKSLLFLRKRIF